MIYPSPRFVQNASAARDFDEVRAVLDDLTHRALAVVWTRTQTGAVFGEELVHVLAVTVDIAMPPENWHPACCKDARTWYLAGRYAVAERIDCVLLWRAGVRYCRKARDRALESEFGWSKAAAAGALIALPITAAVLPFAGSLIDRLGVWRVIAASMIALVACFIWLSRQGGSVGEFYAAMIALNVLGCATGPIGYTRIVVGQFRLARGTALAVAQFGIAFLAVLLPPLLGLAMAANGWRGGYLLLAGACLAGGIAAQLLMRPTEPDASTQEIGGVDVGKAVRMPALWILGASLLAISAASLGLVSQLQSLLIEKGVPQGNTTWLLSLLAASVMLSRLVVGRLLDLPRPERSAAAVMALAAAGAALLLVGNGGMALIVLGITLLGCSVGAELDFMPFFCAREFGLRHYSAIYGVLAMFFYSGIAIGGVGYGAIHDVTGSYGSALLASVILLLCSSLLLLRLGHGREPAIV